MNNRNAQYSSISVDKRHTDRAMSSLKFTASCRLGSKHTYISKLIVGLRDNLGDLGSSASNADLEMWAIFIHDSMCTSSRNYHSVQHVFDISLGSEDPILILSAFFHDVIYWHVDGSFSSLQAHFLDGIFSVDEGGESVVTLTGASDDKLMAVVQSIFGFTAGQKLTPMTGLNEFLSAVIAARVLKDTLDMKLLIDIVVCIEATIPFRAHTEKGSPSDLLYVRLVETNEQLDLGLTDDDCVKAVHRAVQLSNRDVGNFCSKDRIWFLDNTWRLLPETNKKLRQQNVYTAREFHYAVFKMSGFFGFMKPDIVFCQFKGLPTDEEITIMEDECRINLQVGKTYVRAKLLAASIVVAFAELTGGDASMSLFVGDLPSRVHTSVNLMPKQKMPVHRNDDVEMDITVFNILNDGRAAETSFDIKESPLAAYLYRNLGDEGLNKALDRKIFPMGKEEAFDLLCNMPRVLIQTVADNMARVAVTRKEKIYSVLDSLRYDS